MNLLQLPRAIQECLYSPPEPLTIASFSEWALRRILGITDRAAQMQTWQELLLKTSAAAQVN
jgi:hypothetical protein